jgi:hypothetical protein
VLVDAVALDDLDAGQAGVGDRSYSSRGADAADVLRRSGSDPPLAASDGGVAAVARLAASSLIRR